MCRLLLVKSDEEFDMSRYLKDFSKIAKDSKEYQGHGWGMYYLSSDDEWKEYKNISPIWEDDFSRFKKTRLLVAHARSAFEDKDIVIKNNMPFFDGKYVFIFNGELRGVRINEEGRIGAEKIFNFIKRFDHGDIHQAIEKAVPLIVKRSRYVRALNFIIATKEDVFLNSFFSEDPHYFTLHYNYYDKDLVICSDPFEDGWKTIDNNKIIRW